LNRLIGVLLIVISATSFGTLAIFGRYAYADGIDTFTLLFMRFTAAAILMSIFLAFRREALPGSPSLT
jgi:drug/metabolite transporter (DMT)-like permease